MSMRFLALAADPLFHCLILLFLGFFLWRVKRGFFVFVFLEVLIIGYTAVPYYLLALWEEQSVAEMKNAEGLPMVFLGGGCLLENNLLKRNAGGICTLRAVEFIEAVRIQRPNFVILSGATLGVNPLLYTSEMQTLEKHLAREFPNLQIILEEQSRSTFENAQESQKLLSERGISSFYLITSAAHMPRAVRTFRKFGLEPKPMPVDFQAFGQGYFWSQLIGWRNYSFWRILTYEWMATLYYFMSGRVAT